MKVLKKCPHCESILIDAWIGGITGLYFCKKCKYMGPVVLEEEAGP